MSCRVTVNHMLSYPFEAASVANMIDSAMARSDAVAGAKLALRCQAANFFGRKLLGSIVGGKASEVAVKAIAGVAYAEMALSDDEIDRLLDSPFGQAQFAGGRLDYSYPRTIGHVPDEAYEKWMFNNVIYPH